MKGFVCAGIVCLGMAPVALGQWNGSQPVSSAATSVTSGDLTSLRGEIDCASAEGLQVELRGMQPGGAIRADVAPNGTFEFASIPSGSYELTITDASGNVVHREFTGANGGFAVIRIHLNLPKPPSQQAATGTISVARLQHHIPKQAMKELKAAQKAESKKDDKAAVDHLQKAVKIDPECADAWNALGGKYLKAKQTDKALESFQKALTIDPSSFSAQTNAALALLTLGRSEEAELAARQAVRLNGTSPRGRYLLGLALMMQKKYDHETLRNFKAAADGIPRAHLAAAEVLQHMGRPENARTELQQFIATAKPDRLQPEMRAKVESWIARLTPPPGQ